jgi:hypothetical protein
VVLVESELPEVPEVRERHWVSLVQSVESAVLVEQVDLHTVED